MEDQSQFSSSASNLNASMEDESQVSSSASNFNAPMEYQSQVCSSCASNFNAPMEESQVSWSNLPHALWPLIGQCLDTYIDVLRFRSVCRLWRDSIPKLKVIFPLSDPHGPNPNFYCAMSGIAVLFRRIIYSFSPLNRSQSSNSVCCSSSSSPAEGYLAIICSTNVRKRFNLSSFYESNNERKEVNFLDFRIQEVAQSFSIGFPSRQKILMFPDSACINVKLKMDKNIRIFVALDNNGSLFFAEYKYGEGFKSKPWKLISEDSYYDDMIVYKGRIYTVDKQGRVFLIDSSMKFVQISASISVYGDLKHLVECGGELYVVDRFVERNQYRLNRCSIRRWYNVSSMARSVDFEVYRLDQGRGRLVEVKNLGDYAFVLGVDCFSVSTSADLRGIERNCIYFLHDVNSCLSDNYNTHVFDLEKSTILKSSVKILRAPLVWMDWKDCC